MLKDRSTNLLLIEKKKEIMIAVRPAGRKLPENSRKKESQNLSRQKSLRLFATKVKIFAAK